MNSGTLKIEIQVDDKGSVKVRQLGQEVEKTGNKGKKSFTGMHKSLGDFNKSAADTHAKMLKLAGAVASIIAVYQAYKKLISAAEEWVKLAGEQEDAEKKLEAVLTATGHAAGYNLAELNKMAEGMQAVTRFGDEVTISGMAILGTFKQVRGEGFERATMAAMDMSTIMKTDLNSSILQIGKALNDPVKGLTALTRVGVTFTDQQKNQIKALQESGDIMEAQNIILKELESQFGGAAMAAVDNFTGAQIQAANALGDVKEELGYVITKNQFFIDLQKEAAKTFAEWGEKIKENREYLQALAKQGVLKVVNGILTAIKTLQFFNNAWLGIKLVGTAAIHAIAVVLEELFTGLRTLLKPIDLLFDGLVKLGKLDINPFDSIEQGLDDFRASSLDVTKEVLSDTEKINQKFNEWYQTVDKLKNKIEEIPVATKELSIAKLPDIAPPPDLLSSKPMLTGVVDDVEKASFKIESLWENTRDTIQNSMGGGLATALKGQFTSLGDVFKGTTDRMLDAWGSMVSEMIIKQKPLAGMSMMGSLGTMGLIGGAIAIGGSVLGDLFGNDDAEKERERRAELERQRIEKMKAMNQDLQNTINSMTMKPLEYEIYKLNQKYEEQTKQAIALGASLELVAEARAAELKEIMKQATAMHDNLLDSIKDYEQTKLRTDWGVSEYSAEFVRLETVLENLDKNASDYNEKSIQIFEDQFEIIRNIDRLNQEQLQASKDLIAEYDNSINSVDSMITKLTAGSLAPVKSQAGYQSVYDDLLAEALTGNAAAVQDFKAFIPEFSDFMKAAGADYNVLANEMVDDLIDVREVLVDAKSAEILAMEALQEAIEGNTGATGLNTNELGINTLALLGETKDAIDDVKDTINTNVWEEGRIPEPAITFQPSESDSSIMLPTFSADEYAPFFSQLEQLKEWLKVVPEGSDKIDYNAINAYVAWLETMPAFVTNPMQYAAQHGMPALFTQLEKEYEWWQTKPAYDFYKGAGGLTAGLSIAGEIGPEWVVPTYEPQRSSFLRDVGVDSEEIGKTIARELIPYLADKNGQQAHQGEIRVDVRLSPYELGTMVGEQLKTNPKLVKAIKKEVLWR